MYQAHPFTGGFSSESFSLAHNNGTQYPNDQSSGPPPQASPGSPSPHRRPPPCPPLSASPPGRQPAAVTHHHLVASNQASTLASSGINCSLTKPGIAISPPFVNSQ